MKRGDFDISITANAVDVHQTPSATSPHGKLYGAIFIVSGLVLMNCALLFIPDRGSTMWQDIRNARYGTSLFQFPIILLAVATLFLGFIGFRYARAAWASDETFHCDRESITISRIPWLDFSNRTWRTYTYSLSEVTAIRYAVIASAKGRSFWGLRFRANGRKWALPGLEAPEAKDILTALKALGADVPDDPKLEKRIKETLEMRNGDTSWLDRSWMDSDRK